MSKIKYQLSVSYNGYQEAIYTYNTPDKAMQRMQVAVRGTMLNCLKTEYEINAYPTSDSRYKDAWGYANNGYCIKVNGQTWQFEVTEYEDK